MLRVGGKKRCAYSIVNKEAYVRGLKVMNITVICDQVMGRKIHTHTFYISKQNVSPYISLQLSILLTE